MSTAELRRLGNDSLKRHQADSVHSSFLSVPVDRVAPATAPPTCNIRCDKDIGIPSERTVSISRHVKGVACGLFQEFSIM